MAPRRDPQRNRARRPRSPKKSKGEKMSTENKRDRRKSQANRGKGRKTLVHPETSGQLSTAMRPSTGARSTAALEHATNPLSHPPIVHHSPSVCPFVPSSDVPHRRVHPALLHVSPAQERGRLGRRLVQLIRRLLHFRARPRSRAGRHVLVVTRPVRGQMGIVDGRV